MTYHGPRGFLSFSSRLKNNNYKGQIKEKKKGKPLGTEQT